MAFHNYDWSQNATGFMIMMQILHNCTMCKC